ncbi:MAG: hypothetical protein CL431_09540 [Acidimicrobiaceae bacterium]|nr:hypothetical protein [Acidimicrobiaceae bacterium]
MGLTTLLHQRPHQSVVVKGPGRTLRTETLPLSCFKSIVKQNKMIVRLRTTKIGKIRFASHRDIAKVWERSLRRAEIPLVYSEGFHPRPKISFGLALPTGAESECEYLDFHLDDKKYENSKIVAIPEVLTTILPEGIEITGMVKMQNKYVSLQQSVTSTTWEIEVEENKEFVDEWVDHVLSSEELIIKRTRKGKEVVDDIRPYIREISVGQGDLNRSTLQAELKTQPRSLRPSEFLASAQPNLTMARLRRLKQFIDTGDNEIGPLELGERLNSDQELCPS